MTTVASNPQSLNARSRTLQVERATIPIEVELQHSTSCYPGAWTIVPRPVALYSL